MLTKITIRNFKKLEQISFDTSQSVVLIGPNNSGKTTIFQALCLWEIGVTSYINAKSKQDLDRKGYVTINRKDLLNSPIADARFLWRNKKVTKNGKGGVEHIKLEVGLEGEQDGKMWKCIAEFTFANAESLTCRIIDGLKEIQKLYDDGSGIHFGFLQAMSGIATTEDKLTQGSIDRKLGEGRTAEVMRNICYEILYPETPKGENYSPEKNWDNLTKHISRLFGSNLSKPEFIKSTGVVELQYEENGIKYDVSSGGRGFQQTLLLLSYLYAHPNTILLLDEPDAHLEVIRQREIFQLLVEVSEEMNCQIIVASHSEVVLNEAAETSKIIALIENTAVSINSSQTANYIRKALTEIGWEKYYLAKLKKQILYLEGSIDLSMLIAFAKKLGHPVEMKLREANVEYVSANVPGLAISNFVSLKEIFPELRGLALFDRISVTPNPKLEIICWGKRELENYFASPIILSRFAMNLAIRLNQDLQLFDRTIRQVIEDYTVPIRLRNLNDAWWDDEKLSDNWLDIIFPEFYKRLHLPQSFFKRDYHQLIYFLHTNEIHTEISVKLDKINALLTG